MKAVIALAIVLAILASGCVSGGRPLQKCPENPDNICSAVYDPVCGQVSPSEWKTYSSPCEACSSGEVTEYYKGDCRLNAINPM